jgi:hypothetical protein
VGKKTLVTPQLKRPLLEIVPKLPMSEVSGRDDMSRVGMFTQGSGASIGILASAVDPRMKVLDALDPWGDWPTWMATSPFVPEDERAEYVKPEFLKRAAALEPIEWLPKIQAKKFLLQDAVFEQTHLGSLKKNCAPQSPLAQLSSSTKRRRTSMQLFGETKDSTGSSTSFGRCRMKLSNIFRAADKSDRKPA